MSKRLRVSIEVISGIYEIVNLVNENRYVGSSKDIYGRWVQHQNELNKGKHYNLHLQRAWQRYKKESFDFRILEQTDNNTETLFEREQYWYDYYSNKNIVLYNASPIAATPSCSTTIEDLKNGKRKTSYAQFMQICNLLQNTDLPFYKISEETGAYINQIYMIYTREYFPDLTKDMVFRVRKNKGESSARAKLTETEVKEIIERMLNNEYDIDIAQLYNVSYGTIDDIRHHRTWKELTDGIEFLYNKATGRNNKPILQYDLEGNFIAEYENARVAERATGIGFRMISRVCNGDRPHTHGYIFRFKTKQND